METAVVEEGVADGDVDDAVVVAWSDDIFSSQNEDLLG